MEKQSNGPLKEGVFAKEVVKESELIEWVWLCRAILQQWHSISKLPTFPVINLATSHKKLYSCIMHCLHHEVQLFQMSIVKSTNWMHYEQNQNCDAPIY